MTVNAALCDSFVSTQPGNRVQPAVQSVAPTAPQNVPAASKPAGGVSQPVSTGEPTIGAQLGAVRLFGLVSIGLTSSLFVESPPIETASSKQVCGVGQSFSTPPLTSKLAGHAAVAFVPLTKYVFLTASAPFEN